MEEQVGSISSGTLREFDLIPRFLAELERRHRNRAIAIKEEYSEVLPRVYREDPLDIGSDSSYVEMVGWLLEDLQTQLQEIAPAGYYFGTLEGDGADFGFWPVTDDG